MINIILMGDFWGVKFINLIFKLFLIENINIFNHKIKV